MAVAVVQAGSCSSNATPSLGTSICLRCGPKKTKQTNKHPFLKGIRESGFFNLELPGLLASCPAINTVLSAQRVVTAMVPVQSLAPELPHAVSLSKKKKKKKKRGLFAFGIASTNRMR